ncbi:DUF4855 domain-containing protein [Paenisporosarcina indica]|uniref:DUF4855 domain-containing protein n=1 Tax=Paenisporosarcina indica TaxID=650093 RepID=UPI00094F5759|nr:DUF4855 domain-containing protein [Paenisporosarcina indica]
MNLKKKISSLLAICLVTTLFFSTSSYANTYKDVSYKYWAYQDINFLTSHKVINGFKDGYFKPGIVITRKDAAVMMVRALELSELGNQPYEIKDMKTTSPGYKEVSIALSQGWFSTFEGEFKPTEFLTRNEMAKALAIAFDFTGDNTSKFKDILMTDLYYEYIDAILYRGVTTGYSDGTFRPLEKVTRAQFTAFLSRVFHQPIAYEIKVNGEVVDKVPSIEEALALSKQYEQSTIHPASNRYKQFSQTIASADKTGIKAGALIYNGVGEVNTFTPSFFNPYLSYQTINYTNQPMFDTYIILGLRYEGGQFAENALNKANYAEWQSQIDRTFADSGALNNLNEAAKYQNRKADVYIAIPYPKRTEPFMTLDGREIANNLYSRYDIAKWFITSTMDKLEEERYSNLNFKGFYWMNETIKVAEDATLISSLAQTIHSKDKFFIYAPHATSTNFENWQSYGFDAAFLQPNAFRKSVANKDERLHRAFINAQIYGSGITIEIDSYAPFQAEDGVEAFNLYMDYAKRYGLDKNSMIFYQGTDMVVRMSTYDHPVYRLWYQQLTSTFFPETP